MSTATELKGSRKAVLQFDVQPEGVYIFIRKSESSAFPEYDFLQDSLDMAVDFCVADLGIPADVVRKYAPK